MPRPLTSAARSSSSTSPLSRPSVAPEMPASLATALAWPSMSGDFRSTKLATPSSAASSCAPDRVMLSAGSAPITIASGKSEIVRHRRVKNQRLAAAGYVWIFGALRDPAIKAHYDRRRAVGDRHPAAMRNLFNRFIGCLFHCLQTGPTFDVRKAFPNLAAEPERATAA